MVNRDPTCVRFGPMGLWAIGLPLIVWHPMHRPEENVLNPRAGSPDRPGVNVRPSGVGVAGTAYAGILSRGNTSVESQAAGACGAAAGAGCWAGPAACDTGRVAAPWAPAAGAAGAGAGAGGGNIAGLAWCAAHRSKSACDTRKARHRMLAWPSPQYSLQVPLKTVGDIDASGVYHR